MRRYAFATGANLRTVHWTQHEPLTWPEFLDWMALDDPAGRKECGGYVGGQLQETTGHLGKPDCVALHRNKRAVASRSMATLDVDRASSFFALEAAMTLECAMAMYTTWSHTQENPRWRLLIPLSEDVKPEDYRVLVDVLMAELGVEQFDLGSREPERLMHRPSTQGSYYSRVWDGEPLDVAYWLERAHLLGFDVPAEKEPYAGTEEYDDLSHDQQLAADELVQLGIERWRQAWAEALKWPEDHRDDQGRGWEMLARDCAWALARMAATPWMALDEVGAELMYHEVVPEEVLEDAKCTGKWYEGIVEKAANGPVDPPPWHTDDFDVWHQSSPLETMADDYQPEDIGSDLQLGKRVAREYLAGRYLAWGNNRWALWDGRRWDIQVSDDQINGDVREALLDIRKKEIHEADKKRDRAMAKASNSEAEKAAMAAHADRMKVIARLSRVSILDAAKKLSRPDLTVKLEEFDGPETADLLNCGNGVVDLRTGELHPHDPGLKFTKLTEVDYVPGARHPDWDSCCRALPEDAREWVQRKLGQGSTGHAPTDEVVLFMRGGGENGKTTFLLGVRQALGDYYVTVPDKVLNAKPGDHSTEFMPLRGARLAVIEELPDGDWLNGTQLKKAEGSETGMTARFTGQDNVTWNPTHALIATTNHLIQITDVDHGTRRRLCDLNFPYTFSGDARDGGLKTRMKLGKGGQHQAVLAWLVDGAVASYAQPLEREHMPFSVRADTDSWLTATNPAEEFLAMALVYDAECAVLSADVYQMYRAWASENGRRVLSDQRFWERARNASIFTMPDVERTRTRSYGDVVALNPPERGSLARVITCVTYADGWRERVFGV